LYKTESSLKDSRPKLLATLRKFNTKKVTVTSILVIACLF
jgi:hypothetical protein